MHFHVMTGTVRGAPDYLVRCNTLQQAEDHADEIRDDVALDSWILESCDGSCDRNGHTAHDHTQDLTKKSYLDVAQCVFRDNEPICQPDVLTRAVM
jgi:hypothetical protein